MLLNKLNWFEYIIYIYFEYSNIKVYLQMHCVAGTLINIT